MDTPPTPRASSSPESASWTVVRVGADVIATFRGHLDVVEGERSALAFAREVGDLPTRAVFDVRDMTGYDAGARREWIKQLSPIRKQIREIVLRGGNVLVRMGGAAMGAVLGVRVTTE